MLEQNIETIIKTEISTALTENHINTIKIFGCWDVDSDKCTEEKEYDGMLYVKAHPPYYDTPTIPDGIIQVDLALTIRADIDINGATYMDISDIISRTLYNWQKSILNAQQTFNIENEFQCTGFRLSDSDCGIDKENCTWDYVRSFDLYGVILY